MRQLAKTKRRLCLGAFAVAIAPVLIASVASACTQLKNLQANPNSGPAGSTITLTGTNYNRTGAGPVEIRLDSRTSAPIASLPASSIAIVGNAITLDVVIPASASLGYHTLLATQRSTAPGEPLLSGFPVRAAFKVTAVASGKDAAPAPEVAADQQPGVAPSQPAGVTGTVAPDAAAPRPAAAGSPAAPPAAAASAGTAGPTAAAGTSSGGPAGLAGPAGPVDAVTAATSAAPAPAGAVVAPLAPDSVATAGLASAAATAGAPELVDSGLVPAAARGTASALPQLVLSLGSVIVLLGMAAFLATGRTLVAGRRPGAGA